MHTTDHDSNLISKAEAWVSKKADRAKATFSDLGKWTDSAATEARENITELMGKYNIQYDLSDSVRDVVQKIKQAIKGQSHSH